METSIINHNKQPTAYLELILGPMFSGKTSRLLEIYKQCTFCNIPVAVINHSSDTRYDSNDILSTHDQKKIPCFSFTLLSGIVSHPKISTQQVILINEGQFFEDLVPVVQILLRQGKKIYIAGLDGDFERKKFGSILDLIPLCDKVSKLTSLCSQCRDGTPGIFSMRLTHEKQQTLVGSDNYIPVCRNCYNKPVSP
jgi:thymidine kinase